MPLPNPSSPLYERVKDYVLERIAGGDWAPSTRVPSEHELVAGLGVSRMTVHRALRELTRAGVLTRVQGVGTFVAEMRPRSALIEVRDIRREIEGRGRRHAADVIRLESVPGDAGAALEFGLPRGAKVFHSLIVHREDGTPIQLEERWVNPEVAPGYLDQDFERTTPFEYLQKVAPVTEVEHVITAVRPDDRARELLDLAEGEPCLLLRRRTWSGERLVTVNRLVYPGSRYSLGSRWRLADDEALRG